MDFDREVQRGMEAMLVYTEAIENTARELGVAPLALAEAARDGRMLAAAITMVCEEWPGSALKDKFAALRASKPREGE